MAGDEDSLVVAKDLGKRYGDFIALHPLMSRLVLVNFLVFLVQMVQVNQHC